MAPRSCGGCAAPVPVLVLVLVLVLMADNSVRSRVSELDHGADDDMSKPFELEELEARIRVLLRRSARQAKPRLVCADLVYDSNAREISLAGQALPLTPRERAVLAVLIMKSGSTVTKPALAQSLFSIDEPVSADAIGIDVHPLRTPLAVLNTQVAVAGRSAGPVAKDEALAAIRQTLQQAVRLLNPLLTLSAADARAEPQAGGPAPAPPHRLDALVQQVLEDLSAQAQAKRIDLGYEQTGAPPQVAGSPVALREILLNLVDNAIRYTPDRGRVTVKLHAGPGQVALRVQDNGPGIAPAHQAQVFERFFRLDNTRSDGCGLGLAIVRELAAHLDAQVSLSAPAEGSGLVVTVLFAAGAPAGAAPEAASQSSI